MGQGEKERLPRKTRFVCVCLRAPLRPWSAVAQAPRNVTRKVQTLSELNDEARLTMSLGSAGDPSTVRIRMAYEGGREVGWLPASRAETAVVAVVRRRALT